MMRIVSGIELEKQRVNKEDFGENHCVESHNLLYIRRYLHLFGDAAKSRVLDTATSIPETSDWAIVGPSNKLVLHCL